MAFVEIPHKTQFGSKAEQAHGLPTYTPVHGQDANFPFPFDAGSGLYIGYRWDYDEDGFFHQPLTEELVRSIPALFMTSARDFYKSPWVKARCRVTKIFFEMPGHMLHEFGNYRSLFVYKDRQDFSNRELILSPTLSYLSTMGIDAHYAWSPQFNMEMLLLNPGKYVKGVQWTEFEAKK